MTVLETKGRMYSKEKRTISFVQFCWQIEQDDDWRLITDGMVGAKASLQRVQERKAGEILETVSIGTSTKSCAPSRRAENLSITSMRYEVKRDFRDFFSPKMGGMAVLYTDRNGEGKRKNY